MRPVRCCLLRGSRQQIPPRPSFHLSEFSSVSPSCRPALANGIPSSLSDAEPLASTLEDANEGWLKQEGSGRHGAETAARSPIGQAKQSSSSTSTILPLNRNSSKITKQHPSNITRRLPDGNPVDSLSSVARESYTLESKCNDVRQWARLLNYKVRIDGSKGAWRMLDEADKKNIFIPTEGDEADRIWTTLVRAGTRDTRLLQVVYRQALSIYTRDSRKWIPLYENIIGHFLNLHSGHAVRHWHHQLSRLGVPTEQSLNRLVQTAIKSRSRLDMLKILSPSVNLYDALIPALCQKEDFVAAAHWDQYLKDRGDRPSTIDFDFVTIGEGLENSNATYDTSEVADVVALPSYAKRSTHIKPVEYIETARRPRGGLSDEFVARCFATKTFSLDAIIAGLKTIGLSSLGPLGMREMASRCTSTSDVLDRIEKLQSRSVLIQDCIFNRLIHKLAAEEEMDMLDSVVGSDLHPDAYEDPELQKKLLLFYIKSKDWRQAHRTLTLLDTFFERQSVRFWNYMLRAHFIDRDWDRAEEAFETMLSRHIPITSRTIKTSFFAVEQRRYRTIAERSRVDTHAEQLGASRRDDLKIVTNLWLKIQRAGGYIDARSWNQLHKYYGQDSRLAEFESLSIWLALNYSQDSLLTLGNRRWSRQWRTHPNARWDHEDKGASPLSIIFTPLRQQSIVEWGFKSIAMPLKTRDLGFEPKGLSAGWDRGLLLLRELQRLGVTIQHSAIEKACRHRLKVLFSGKSRVSFRRENRMAKENNNENILSMVKRINEIWQVWPEVAIMNEHQARLFILRNPHDTRARRLRASTPSGTSEIFTVQWHRRIVRLKGVRRRRSLIRALGRHVKETM